MVTREGKIRNQDVTSQPTGPSVYGLSGPTPSGTLDKLELVTNHEFYKKTKYL